MPTLISEVDIRMERADLLRRIPLKRDVDPTTGLIVPPARTPGLHQSGLFRYIAEKSKITTYIEQVAEDEHPLRWFLGICIEEGLASLYPSMTWQPGEVTDPLIMNCDGLSLEDVGSGADDQLIIEEFKSNRAKKYSGADLIKKKWLFMQQGASYCLGYEANYVRWHVFALMQWPDPIYTTYLVYFDDSELAQVRRMIEVNREAAVREGFAE